MGGALYDLYQRIPEFAGLARHPVIVKTLQDVYAKNFYLFDNCLVYKAQGRDNAVPFHQDFIARTNEPIKVIVWMAIDDATTENGCVHAIPGSHKRGFLKYHHVPGATHHTRLNRDQFDEAQAVPVEMNAGDVLIFNMLMIHGSYQVDNGMPRRAYRTAYQNFDVSHVPRGAPIVISCADRSQLRVPHHYDEANRQPTPQILSGMARRAKRTLRNMLVPA